MTDIEKNQVITMRRKNITYAAISKALGIPVSTIKTFCRRNGMTTEIHRHKPVCKNCGCKIKNTPGAKAKLFCSDQCRQSWWNKHRKDRVSTNIVPYICRTCGKTFMDYKGTNRKYCSQKCFRERGIRDGQQGL